MYYEVTVEALRDEIKRRQPRTKATFRKLRLGKVAPLAYLLWMCDEIEKMDPTGEEDQSLKAARWIGWMLAHAELNGLWDNERSRELIRTDCRRGYNKPYHIG